MSEVPFPLRKLSEATERSLFWGRTLLTLSLTGCAMVTLGLLIGVLIYQVGFSSWRARQGEVVRAESKISSVDWVRSPAGSARGASAPIRVNDVMIEVYGYGPRVESARIGDKVTVVVPATAPNLAYLEGYWPEPVPLGTLLKIAGCFYLPCLGWTVIIWMRGRRLKRVLSEGEVVPASRLRGFSLPRPFLDYRVAEWETPEKSRFWSLTPKSPDPPTLLRRGKDQVFLEAALNGPEIKDGTIECDDTVSRLVASLNRMLFAVNLLLLLASIVT